VTKSALTGLLFFVALFGEVLAALADERYAPPPRSIDDVLAVLEQYHPDAAELAGARRRASSEPPATEDRNVLAAFYHSRAIAEGRLGYVSRQIEDLRRAAEFAKGNMDMRAGENARPGAEHHILSQLAYAELNAGNYLNAVRTSEAELRAAEIGSRKGRKMGGIQLGMQSSLARMATLVGDVETARDRLSAADRLYRQLWLNRGWAERQYGWTYYVESARGALFKAEGKYAAAEAAQRKALDSLEQGAELMLRMYKDGEDVPGPGTWETRRVLTEIDLADVLKAQGRLAEAEFSARSALKRSLSFYGRYHLLSANTITALSGVLAEEGRFREALLLSDAAIKTLEGLGVVPESILLAQARTSYGSALVAQDQFPEAAAVFAAMREGLARDPLVAAQYGGDNIDWAYALVRTGEARRAVDMLRGLIQVTQKRLGERDYQVMELRGFLGIALAASGERDTALSEFRAAIPTLIEQSRIDHGSENTGIARARRLNLILSGYIELLSELYRSGAQVSGLDLIAESFRIADVARASSVQRAFTAAAVRGAIRDPNLAALAREEQDAQRRLGSLSDLLSRLLAAPPEQQLTKIIGDVRRDIDALRKTHADLKTKIEREFPNYANLVDPKPVTIEDARQALRPGEALITMFSTSERCFVWAVPRDGKPAFAIISASERDLADKVRHLRGALDLSGPVLRLPRFNIAIAYDLYREVLAPVEPAWKGARNLLIAPHGALAQLPFSLLPTEPAEQPRATPSEDYSTVSWLIKRAAVTQLPSVATLTTLRALPPTAANRRAFVGFGDPLFSKAQAAEAASEGATKLAGAGGTRMRNLSIAKVAAPPLVEPVEDGEARPPLRAAPVVNSASAAQLSRLPDTASEILQIAESLHADKHRDVFLEARASETTLKRLDLSDRRIIAFATHGLVPGDLDGLTQPALALSSPEVTGETGEDGLLTLEEIFGLKLNADWVVLSACNTGAGEGAGSEAVSGLGRGFFYAGARSLLVSNWPVETVSARLLTTHLFQLQAKNPDLTRAEALRLSMLDLMGAPERSGKTTERANSAYSHPLFWAAFSLLGDGGR
jgi:CHAT domain-containing protein